MSRIKRGIISRAKHKKLLNLTKGFRGTKSRLVKVAKEAALHAGQYAFEGRKNKKRNFRRSWNLRIGEAVKLQGISYSKFIFGLKQQKIELDRKTLSNLIEAEPETFKLIVDKVKNVSFAH